MLRPTQMTVGLDYVDAKALTARYPGAALERLMLDQAIRIVMAPGSKPCIVDYHRWARAR